MNEIVLSDKYSIIKGEYNWEYSKHEFLDLVKFNEDNVIKTNDNSTWLEIEAPCFNHINRKILNFIESVTNKEIIYYAKHNWVYTQRKDFDLEWMHQHIFVHPPNRSKILSDYTFTFYLQTTDEIEGDEGCIIFEDEYKKRHKFLPKEGDIFLFPGDLRHTAMPTPNSSKDRIVYAGSFCIDIFNQKNDSKSII